MSIEAIDITKKFGQFAALDHVDLNIPSGELVALLGPSGSMAKTRRIATPVTAASASSFSTTRSSGT